MFLFCLVLGSSQLEGSVYFGNSLKKDEDKLERVRQRAMKIAGDAESTASKEELTVFQ